MSVDLVIALLAAPVGLVVGGALTTVIDRAPDGEPFDHPLGRCPSCQHPLRASEVVPLISWVRNRGRCRTCEAPVSPTYPVVETVTAGLFVAASLRFGAAWILVPFLVFYAVLVAVSVVDLYQYRIPDRILFPGLGVSLALIVVVSLANGEPRAITRALAGAGIYFALLLIMHIAVPAGMGFGDVKLAGLLGLFVGWIGFDTVNTLRLILISFILSAFLSLVGGATLFVARRVTGRVLLPDPDAEPGDVPPFRKTAIPFGPALAAAAIVGTLFSAQLLNT